MVVMVVIGVGSLVAVVVYRYDVGSLITVENLLELVVKVSLVWQL